MMLFTRLQVVCRLAPLLVLTACFTVDNDMQRADRSELQLTAKYRSIRVVQGDLTDKEASSILNPRLAEMNSCIGEGRRQSPTTGSTDLEFRIKVEKTGRVGATKFRKRPLAGTKSCIEDVVADLRFPKIRGSKSAVVQVTVYWQ